MIPEAAPQLPGTATSSDASSDPAALPPVETSGLTAEQLVELTDEGKQAEYQRQFWVQQQRRACPGCGDW